jgi:hypothetical protein
MVGAEVEPAAPPPQAPSPWAEPPAYFYPATQLSPRKGREEELCERASSTDWLYIGAMGLGVIGSAYADLAYFKHWPHGENPAAPRPPTFGDSVVRTMPPAFFGLFWGGLVGGTYLALPKCSPTWVDAPPPEGEVRSTLPIAVSLALLSGLTAPFLVATYTGPIKVEWPVSERWVRHIVPVGTAIAGAFIPYLLPPRTWAAKKELERIRFGGDGTSAFVSYTVAF